MEPRLSTNIWVKVQIRLCDRLGLGIAVRRRGDGESGAVLVVLNRLALGTSVFAQVRDADGGLAWLATTGPEPVPEAEAEAYLTRALARDPDLWVLEIEDPHGRYTFDSKILR